MRWLTWERECCENLWRAAGGGPHTSGEALQKGSGMGPNDPRCCPTQPAHFQTRFANKPLAAMVKLSCTGTFLTCKNLPVIYITKVWC